MNKQRVCLRFADKTSGTGDNFSVPFPIQHFDLSKKHNMELISVSAKSATVAGVVQCHLSISQPNSYDSSATHPSAPVAIGLCSGTQYQIEPSRGEISSVVISDNVTVNLSFIDGTAYPVPTFVCLIVDIYEVC